MIKKNKTNKLKTQSHNVRELAFDNITLPPLQFQQTQIVSNSCYAMQQCGKFSLLVLGLRVFVWKLVGVDLGGFKVESA